MAARCGGSARESATAVKRRLLIVAVFLLAGALVNVVATWMLALRFDRFPGATLPRANETHGGGIHPHDGRHWSFHLSAGFGAARLRAISYPNPEPGSQLPAFPQDAVPSWSRLARPPKVASDAAPLEWLEEHARGWPMLSMLYRGQRYAGGSLQLSTVTKVSNFPSRGRASLLPMAIIWPGFVVNTVFCAVVLWLLCGGPFALRRLIRVKRGLCPACAYRRGESDVCSECGKALPTSRASRHIIV